MKIIPAAICLLALAPTARAAEDVDAIIAGIAARHSQYRNLKFTYNVRVNGAPPKLAPELLSVTRYEPPAAIHQLRILKSNESEVVWRHWRRYLDHDKPEQRIDRFASWNGEVARVFVRRAPWDVWGSNQAVVRGQFSPWDFDCNLFDNFLFLDLTGLNQSVFDARELDLLSPRNFKVTTTEDDPVHGKVMRLRGYLPLSRIWYEIVVTDAPDFMVVRWDATDGADGRVVTTYQTTAVGHIDGLAYPRAGRYTQPKLSEHALAYDYAFDVTDVERVPKEARQEWDIPWPTGTVVSDQVNNQVFTVEEQPQ
jgi:hypothetical protein